MFGSSVGKVAGMGIYSQPLSDALGQAGSDLGGFIQF